MRGRGKSIRTGNFFTRGRSRAVAAAIPTVDLHGLRHHIGEQRVANFMREQINAGARSVRIVHGNGQGVMRDVAYAWIEKNRHRVLEHKDVGPAVIVYLRR